MPVQLEPARDDGVVVARIDGGRGNSLDAATVAGLGDAVSGLADGEALVLTGREGTFSGGLDLATLGAGGESAERLLSDMGRVLRRVIESPRPVVVAANGHGVAAGAMLMLAADLAIVSDRPARYGFAEVRNGIALPAGVVALISARADPAATLRLAAHGELVGPDEAVRVGLADQVVPADELMDVAVTRAAELAALPPEPYAATKQIVAAPLVAAMRPATS